MTEAQSLANQILTYSRSSLLVSLRFLDMAIGALQEKSVEKPFDSGKPLATDGESLFYHPVSVLKAFKESREEVSHELLHSIFHCVFSHPFVSTLLHRRYWNLACDIAVESVISELGLFSSDVQREEIMALGIKPVTAERVYRYLLDSKLSDAKLEALEKLFAFDDHELWYVSSPSAASEHRSADGDLPNELPADVTPDILEDEPTGTLNREMDASFDDSSITGDNDREKDLTGILFSMSRARESMQKFWDDIARRMKTDLATFSKTRSTQSGALIQQLNAVTRERYDYAKFLRQFSVMGETLQLNDEEFDNNFYTFGLKTYGNMPLIEPLEYKDVKRIRDFVIAIDTSGSVSGALVQKFMQKTYNILLQEENFFKKINLHVIQCDSSVKKDTVITCRKDFDEFIENIRLVGFGGTDFRPVFSYVDTLLKEKQFANLKGLIYFTDGEGIFPERKPDYETAFVFVDDGFRNPYVPPWAMKVTLQSEEI